MEEHEGPKTEPKEDRATPLETERRTDGLRHIASVLRPVVERVTARD